MAAMTVPPGGRCSGFWTVVILTQFQLSDLTRCLKRDEIEYRDGNVYECLDPNRPACCEIGNSFTCCEEPWRTAVRNQLWLFLALALLMLFAVFLCSCCRGQPQIFKASTAKSAMQTWRDRVYSRFSKKPPKTQFDVPHK